VSSSIPETQNFSSEFGASSKKPTENSALLNKKQTTSGVSSKSKDHISNKPMRINDYNYNQNITIPEASKDGFNQSTPAKPSRGTPSVQKHPRDTAKNLSGSGEIDYDNNTFGGPGFQPSSHKKSSKLDEFSRSPSQYDSHPARQHASEVYDQAQQEKKKPDELYLPDDNFSKAFAKNNPKKQTPNSLKPSNQNLGAYPGLDEVPSLENSSLLNPSILANTNLDKKVAVSPKNAYNNNLRNSSNLKMENSSGQKLDSNTRWQSPSHNNSGGPALSKSL
jgi:hypothetical protein